MKKVLIFLGSVILIFASCKDKKGEVVKKYPDYFVDNLHGDIATIQDSTFVVDSAGTIKPDSIFYGFGEYKDNYLITFKDKDTTGKETTSTYSHFDDGLLKGIITIMNGKTVYKLDVQLDSQGHYNTAQSYDTAGKLNYYNTALKMDENGMLISGKLYKDSTLMYAFAGTYNKNVYIGGGNFDSTGKQTEKTTIKQNEKGDPQEETTITYGHDSTTTKIKRYDYVYDPTDNWIEKKELNEKGKPVKIIKRAITYVKKE